MAAHDDVPRQGDDRMESREGVLRPTAGQLDGLGDDPTGAKADHEWRHRGGRAAGAVAQEAAQEHAHRVLAIVRSGASG